MSGITTVIQEQLPVLDGTGTATTQATLRTKAEIQLVNSQGVGQVDANNRPILVDQVYDQVAAYYLGILAAAAGATKITPTAYTPVAAATSAVAVANDAVEVFLPNTIENGAYITNLPENNISLFVNMVAGTATTTPGGTNEEVPPGSTWRAPGPLTTSVWVNAASPLSFNAVSY